MKEDCRRDKKMPAPENAGFVHVNKLDEKETTLAAAERTEFLAIQMVDADQTYNGRGISEATR
jgi:hypothetical protein